MKKLMTYLTAILMVMFFTTLKAQNENNSAMNSLKSVKKSETKAERKEVRKEDRNMVSDVSKENFIRDFGRIPNVKWEKSQFFEEAEFTQDSHQYKAFYGDDSKLIGTTTEKTFTDLPKNGQKEIQKQYESYKIDKVVYFEDNQENDKDMQLYGTQFEDADNYFVELSNKDKNIVIQINPKGQVHFFKELAKEI